MSPDTPAPRPAPSQRTLAAIVFTDVVSFSARMHTDEVATLKLLHRDFAEMRRLCSEFEGSVLKTTGDGLLLTFTSAVQAVACALAMQRQFAAEATHPESANALQHRIGIHLGDVLVQDQDVMGDGVNIAARLQSEAEPGGICISQTVYDVVKNKLEMRAVSLGPRDLKNISQAMPVYRLLLDAQALDSAHSPAGDSAKRRQALKILLTTVLSMAVGISVYLIVQHVRQPAAPSATPTPAAAAPAPAPAAPPAAAQAAAPADIASDLSEAYDKRQDTMQELHALYLDKYDFSGLLLALRDKAESPSAPPALKQMLRSAEQLSRLRTWLESSLRRHNRQNPVVGRDLGGDAAKDVNVYLALDERIVFIEGGNPLPRDWPDVKPPVLGSVIVGALRDAPETRRSITMAAQTFARIYSLPLMSKAITASKATETQATK